MTVREWANRRHRFDENGQRVARFTKDCLAGDRVQVQGQAATVLSVGLSGGILRFDDGREYPVRFAEES